jgi:K(+)-stimulated pyrophosphate-energized sodium pump
MGADLYESYVGSILATFALGVAAYPDMSWEAMLLPIALAVVGILCSIFGSFLIRTKEGASQRELLGTLRWLTDEKASGFVTGIVVPVDGGFSAYSGV